jgi:hypothetical protein
MTGMAPGMQVLQWKPVWYRAQARGTSSVLRKISAQTELELGTSPLRCLPF